MNKESDCVRHIGPRGVEHPNKKRVKMHGKNIIIKHLKEKEENNKNNRRVIFLNIQ